MHAQPGKPGGEKELRKKRSWKKSANQRSIGADQATVVALPKAQAVRLIMFIIVFTVQYIDEDHEIDDDGDEDDD